MSPIIRVSMHLALSGVLAAEDFARLAAQGFRSVVSVRPDQEDANQITGRAEAVQAWRTGLQFRHVPVTFSELFRDDRIEALADALASLEAPILVHCSTGRRAALLWAATAARTAPVHHVIAALEAAGVDVSRQQRELASQAGRKRWIGRIPALQLAPARRAGTRRQAAA